MDANDLAKMLHGDAIVPAGEPRWHPFTNEQGDRGSANTIRRQRLRQLRRYRSTDRRGEAMSLTLWIVVIGWPCVGLYLWRDLGWPWPWQVIGRAIAKSRDDRA